jgi:hypothetical protein
MYVIEYVQFGASEKTAVKVCCKPSDNIPEILYGRGLVKGAEEGKESPLG